MMSNSIFDLENGGSTYTQGNTVGIVPDNGGLNTGSSVKKSGNFLFVIEPGFHIVVSVVQKKFIGQIQLYGNLPYKCSIQKKRQIQLVVMIE